MKLWVFVTLLVAAQAYEQCRCYESGSGGFWQSSDWTTGANCDTCQPGYDFTNNCRTKIPQACNAATTCNGHGTCLANGDCQCDGLHTGTYCDQCIAGLANYPACDQTDCAAATTCGGHGSCYAEPISCGTVGCNPQTHYCYRYQDLKYCVPKPKSGCGANLANACDWDEHCGEPEFALCCKDGYDACVPTYDDGTPRAMGQCCHPSQKCCDGACCSSEESCEKVPESYHGYVDSSGDPLGYTPHVCTNVVLTSMTAVRVIMVPMILAIVTILITVFALRYSAEGSGDFKFLRLMSLLVIFFSVLLFFNPSWPHATMIVLVSVITLYATRAPHWMKWVLLAQILTLIIMLGGVDLGYLIVVGNAEFFPQLASSSGGGTHAQLASKQSNCARYYNYFWYDNALLKWDHNPQTQYWGYCAIHWLATVQLTAALVVGLMLVLICLTMAKAFGGPAPSENKSGDMQMTQV